MVNKPRRNKRVGIEVTKLRRNEQYFGIKENSASSKNDKVSVENKEKEPLIRFGNCFGQFKSNKNE